MRYILVFLGIIYFGFFNLHSEEVSSRFKNERLKVLHLSFHRGCIQEFIGISKLLDIEVESWFIPDLPPKFFDGVAQGNALYNITHERAERIWNKHKKIFERYDVILVSDTAPLSRIFLQNNWEKPLIVWVCNRFDYSDCASLDGVFPDQEYYDLFKAATHQKNVFIIPYTAFERHYAKNKGIDMNGSVITPCYPEINTSMQSSIPVSVNKAQSIFLPPYHNETKFMDLWSFCGSLGIKAYCGRYNGPSDLKDFKAIIHLPYNWSNLAFFENSRMGIPYFVPSEKFLEQLLATGKYFHADVRFLTKEQQFGLSEWYSSANRDIITYFDSWEDLKNKLEKTDFKELKKKVLSYATFHFQSMLDRWNRVFERIQKLPRILCERANPSISPFVIGRLSGQLGNQLFIVAATVNLALQNGATPIFPDFIGQKDHSYNLQDNYEQIFSRLEATAPTDEIEYYYREPVYSYSAIPYHDNMEIRGWFQSEKYFLEHKKEIIELFSPSPEIMNYLKLKYSDIIDHPHTVSIHVRSYLKEDPNQKVYVNLEMDYYKAAMSHFPENTLFVVFSQHMNWCKDHFSQIGKNVRFIEGEPHYHDLYLMSLCKNNIICNSTFSWWGAYLNQNPNKKVIAPARWFAPAYNHDTKDLVPKEWTLQ